MSKRKNKFPYVRQGENDLATLNPELVPEWMDSNDRKPTEVAAGSHYKAWWKCSKFDVLPWLKPRDSNTLSC